jgi:hypothetical protein
VERRIFVATSGALAGLAHDGTDFAGSDFSGSDFAGSDVGAVVAGAETWWAIVDRHEVWLGAPGSWDRVAVVNEHRLTCIVPVTGGVVAGTSKARLARIGSDGDISFVDEFDALDDREQWFTPWGGPPDVRSLAIDNDGTLFVNVHVGGILRSEDGTTFTRTIDIRSDVHEVVAANGLLLAATARGLATSDDSGRSWSFDASGLHATYCRAVAVAGDTLLLSASVGPYGGRAAVYRRPLTGDGTFSKCVEGLPEWFSDNIDTGCLAARGNTAAFATSDGRVFSTDDGGETWIQLAAGLEPARWLLMP